MNMHITSWPPLRWFYLTGKRHKDSWPGKRPANLTLCFPFFPLFLVHEVPWIHASSALKISHHPTLRPALVAKQILVEDLSAVTQTLQVVHIHLQSHTVCLIFKQNKILFNYCSKFLSLKFFMISIHCLCHFLNSEVVSTLLNSHMISKLYLSIFKYSISSSGVLQLQQVPQILCSCINGDLDNTN